MPVNALSPQTNWQLGAPLYVPALHPDLLNIANAEKIAFIRSMIICTEDAIAEQDVELSLQRIAHFLPMINAAPTRYRFIRPRNPHILQRILELPGIEKIDGFVLPKFNASNYNDYCDLLRGRDFFMMPTLETADVFNPVDMQNLAAQLSQDTIKTQILMLRIGGNDLLNLLGIRRPRGVTLYETPLAHVIAQLVITFKPLGLALSAPVYEYLDDDTTLAREIALDIAHGLVGKTAIHPRQIGVIEPHYAVAKADYEAAIAILDDQSPAVFKMHQAMCEVATHRVWAEHILLRYACFGLLNTESFDVFSLS